MVKGISRRVVIVKPEDGDTFEQAIFILRDNGREKCDVLREACRVADTYVRGARYRVTGAKYTRNQMLLAGAAGAAATCAVWIAGFLIF